MVKRYRPAATRQMSPGGVGHRLAAVAAAAEQCAGELLGDQILSPSGKESGGFLFSPFVFIVSV